jgi:hypothetical protein
LEGTLANGGGFHHAECPLQAKHQLVIARSRIV